MRKFDRYIFCSDVYVQLFNMSTTDYKEKKNQLINPLNGDELAIDLHARLMTKGESDKSESYKVLGLYGEIRCREYWSIISPIFYTVLDEYWGMINDGSQVLSYEFYEKLYENTCDVVVELLNGVPFTLTQEARNDRREKMVAQN